MELSEHGYDEQPVDDCDCRRCAIATRNALRTELSEAHRRCLLRALQIVGWHINDCNRAQLQPVYDELARSMPTEEAAREIVRLRQKVRERGHLLAAIYNCEAAMKGDIPDELLKQIDELVFFPKRNMSANASLTGGEAVRLKR